MGATKKIVVEGYPVENLPEDLRQRLGTTGVVTVTIEAARDSRSHRQLADLYGCGAGFYASHGHDPAAFVSGLRDEWE